MSFTGDQEAASLISVRGLEIFLWVQQINWERAYLYIYISQRPVTTFLTLHYWRLRYKWHTRLGGWQYQCTTSVIDRVPGWGICGRRSSEEFSFPSNLTFTMYSNDYIIPLIPVILWVSTCGICHQSLFDTEKSGKKCLHGREWGPQTTL